jgi:hypothetical protein
MSLTNSRSLTLRLAFALMVVSTMLAGMQACSTPRPSGGDTDSGAPGVERDEFLDHLVGEWRITRRMQSRTVENTMSAHWVLGGSFVQLHMIDVAKPPAYEAIVLIGRDQKRDRYVAYWCDTFGPAYSAVGYGVARGDSVEFSFPYEEGPFVNTFTWHGAEHSWTFLGETVSDGGKREFFMEDTATPVTP